jgi:hypothetical protein
MSQVRYYGKKALQIFGTVAFFLVLILVYNVVSPTSFMSRLWEGYWGGYYQTETFGKVWCLGRFYRPSSGKIVMVMLSPGKTTDLYDVERDSTDETFLNLKMRERGGTISIEAKQLYLGQRYVIERLTAGRFKDFWERNDDDDIKGEWITGKGQRQEFALERISEDTVIPFCRNALGEESFTSVSDLETLLARTAKAGEEAQVR